MRASRRPWPWLCAFALAHAALAVAAPEPERRAGEQASGHDERSARAPAALTEGRAGATSTLAARRADAGTTPRVEVNRLRRIKIEGDREFQAQVRGALDEILGTPSGQRLLGGIETSGQTVTIRKHTKNNIGIHERDRAHESGDGGIDSIVEFNPNLTVGPGGPRPISVALFHEMVHAWDYAHDTIATNVKGVPNLEHSAIGLPFDHSNARSSHGRLVRYTDPDRPTENDYRADLGLKLRDSY